MGSDNNYGIEAGPYDQQAHGPVGSTYGWIYVRAPNGKVWSVPPDSPEGKTLPKITLTGQGGKSGAYGQATSARWSDEAPGVDHTTQTGAPPPTTPNGQQNTPDTLDYNAQIADFYRRMTAPLDMNDPEVKQAIATGVSATQRQGNMSGVFGGLSQMGLARSAMSAQLGLANQRRQMGLQALTLGSNRDFGLGTEAGINSRFGQDMAQSQQINAQRQNTANMQAVAAAGGQVAGGLAQFAKGSGSSGGSTPNNVGGSGSFNTDTGSYGSDPSNWQNPY